MDVIANGDPELPLWDDLLSQLRALMREREAHPTRTVVLVPYLQLVSQARQSWARAAPHGFCPRFETTMNWAGSLPFTPGADDLSFDRGRDLLTARAWLEKAGLDGRADLLAGRLVDQSWQLAGVASAEPPARRAAWAAQARALVSAGMEAPQLALEAAIARIALEWAAASDYASDRLQHLGPGLTLDLLVVLEGLQADPLANSLMTLLGDKAVSLPLVRPRALGSVGLHPALDPSDEAERAAACVLQQVGAGRVPVALVATDRVLTRRIRALLEGCGLQIRDETGWKLSTTRACASLMAALRACAWNAGSDAVIDWLKNAPGFAPPEVSQLERLVRRLGLREWRSVQRTDAGDGAPRHLLDQINALRQGLQDPRALPQWLAALRAVLQEAGQWAPLQADAAGLKMIATLGLDEPGQAQLQQLPQAARRWRQSEFVAWVGDCLEAESFVPASPPQEQVVILPMFHVLGRTVGALVLPGCDELGLPASPEPTGPWTAAQRQALGLPSRAALAAQLRAAWRHALETAHCDVLWRVSDDKGEPILPSPLVLELQFLKLGSLADDPRRLREIAVAPVARPQAVGRALAPAPLSASAYEDLRRCPYRFFALRQLGLREADEIDDELNKRDFGNWLHAVLRAFHESLRSNGVPPGAQQLELMELCAVQATRQMRLDAGEFLPFAAAWPAARDGYLEWLAEHQAQGAQFERAESEHEMPLGPLKLVGRIDRIDRLPGGGAMVMDYKTEALKTTSERVLRPTEDTQLAFYAALLADDTLRAAYVNIGERGKTETIEQDQVVGARDLLVPALLADMQRIADGAALPALGEGQVCEFCAARGLCRRDFWSD